MNIFLVVVSTFNPVFLNINELRRQQCKKYNIPVLFVYNGKKPESYELKSDERVFPMENHAPAMFLKFKYAIQEIYNNDNVDPEYIVRVTTRAYINFENLKFFMSYLGKERVAAGPFQMNDNKLYLQGTCMIFSRDVAKRFAEENNVHGPVLWHSDDCTISWAVKDYADFYDMNYFYEHTDKLFLKTIPTALPEFILKPIIFRIRNGTPNGSPFGTPLTYEEKIDVECWRLLLKEYDGIEADEAY